MNLIIKLMDRDNKGFRLISVGEPIDIHVKPRQGDSNWGPHLLVNHSIPSLSKSYPLTGNVYIMNEAGDTVSKIDAKDFGVEPGMGSLYKEQLTTGAASFNINDALGIDPTSVVAKAREIFYAAHPEIREALAKVNLIPGGAFEEEELDSGTILAKFGEKVGAYLDGHFVDAHALTSRDIKRFKVYAKPEMVKQLREEGLIPESKLNMLENNDKLVNGKEKDPETPVVYGDPKCQLALWEAVTGHLSPATRDRALNKIDSLTLDHLEHVSAAVATVGEHAELSLLLRGEIQAMYSGDKVYAKADVVEHSAELFECFKNKDPKVKWYLFSRKEHGIEITEVDPNEGLIQDPNNHTEEIFSNLSDEMAGLATEMIFKLHKQDYPHISMVVVTLPEDCGYKRVYILGNGITKACYMGAEELPFATAQVGGTTLPFTAPDPQWYRIEVDSDAGTFKSIKMSEDSIPRLLDTRGPANGMEMAYGRPYQS